MDQNYGQLSHISINYLTVSKPELCNCAVRASPLCTIQPQPATIAFFKIRVFFLHFTKLSQMPMGY